jgi:hypothetical protein
MPDANLHLIEDAATKLGSLLDGIVFVGGATLGLLVTDPAAAPARPTMDVDVIAEITTYLDYIAFSERLRSKGFAEDDRKGAPLCRWLHGGLILDVMPLDDKVLGFGNRWYRGAHESSWQTVLPSGTQIRVISAPYFLGTKFDAFRGRGKRDFYESRDLEDFVSVIDGRNSIVDEIGVAPSELRIHLNEAAKELLSQPRFLDALPAYLLPDEISQNRYRGILRKLTLLAGERVH